MQSYRLWLEKWSSLTALSNRFDRKAIAAEIVAAEKSTGRSHWDAGAEIAKRHGVSVFDVHDGYMKELDRLDRVQQRRESPVTVAGLAPILDPLGFDAFIVGGASVFDNSIRL